MTTFEQPVIGDALFEAIPTRRDTAFAEPIPAGIPLTAPSGTAAPILGHPSAYRRIAISTREHHCGGAPIHHVPARRNPTNTHHHHVAARALQAPDENARLVNDCSRAAASTARALDTPQRST